MFFFQAETPTKQAKTPTKQTKTHMKQTKIPKIYKSSVIRHLTQKSSKSPKNPLGQKKHSRQKIMFGLKFQPDQIQAKKTA